jgi:hypothetical protein
MTTAQLSRGRTRMRELALEAETERKAIETDLLASIGRPATPLDCIAAETIAAAVVRARKLRQYGGDDSEQRRQIAQLMRASNFKPDKPATAPKPQTLQQRLAARGYKPPVAPEPPER